MLHGGDGDDTIHGSQPGDALFGGRGDDVLTGRFRGAGLAARMLDCGGGRDVVTTQLHGQLLRRCEAVCDTRVPLRTTRGALRLVLRCVTCSVTVWLWRGPERRYLGRASTGPADTPGKRRVHTFVLRSARRLRRGDMLELAPVALASDRSALWRRHGHWRVRLG